MKKKSAGKAIRKQRTKVAIAAVLSVISLLCAVSCTDNSDNEQTATESTAVQTGENTEVHESTQPTTAGQTEEVTTQQESTTEMPTIIPAEESVNGFIDACFTAVLSVGETDRQEYKKVLDAAHSYSDDGNKDSFRQVCEQARDVIKNNTPSQIIVSDDLSAELAENMLVYQKLTALADSRLTKKDKMLSVIDMYLDNISSQTVVSEIYEIDIEKYSCDCQLAFAQLNEALSGLSEEQLDYFRSSCLTKLTTLTQTQLTWTDNLQLLHVRIDNLRVLSDDCASRIAQLEG